MATVSSTEVRGTIRIVNYVERDLCADLVHLANRRDTSPAYRGPYNAACSPCWLHHGHTEDKHAASVAA